MGGHGKSAPASCTPECRFWHFHFSQVSVFSCTTYDSRNAITFSQSPQARHKEIPHHRRSEEFDCATGSADAASTRAMEYEVCCLLKVPPTATGGCWQAVISARPKQGRCVKQQCFQGDVTDWAIIHHYSKIAHQPSQGATQSLALPIYAKITVSMAVILILSQT